VHRVAWFLFVAAVVVCGASAFVDRPWSVVAPAGAAALLLGGLAVSWSNGRAIERRWRDDAIGTTLEVERAVAEFTRRGVTRYAIAGRVAAPGFPAGERAFQAFVPVADASRVVAGARLPVKVRPGDDAVRLYLHPDRFVTLQPR